MDESSCGSRRSDSWKDGHNDHSESKEGHTVEEAVQEDEQFVRIHKQVYANHQSDQCCLHEVYASVKYKPAQHVAGVLESHHLHTLSGLVFFLFCQLGYDIVQGYQECKHNEEGKLLRQLVCGQRNH